MENTCVVCGAIIPEGRQVCPNCEAGQKPERKKDDSEQKDTLTHINTHYSKGGGHDVDGYKYPME